MLKPVKDDLLRALIAEHFPSEVCISKPKGGSVLWVRCQSHVNTSEFFQVALEQGVSFAPGIIFSPSGKYANYMRISYGIKWSEQVEKAIKTLGDLVFLYTQQQLEQKQLKQKQLAPVQLVSIPAKQTSELK